MRPLSTSIGPIGLDIGHNRVKAVQLRAARARPVAHATACFDRLEPGQALSRREARRIAEVLARRGFVGNRVALAVPHDMLIELLIDVPPAGGSASRTQVVRMEIARQQKIAPDRLEVAYEQLPQNEHAGQREQVMAFGLAHNQMTALIGPLDQAGLEVLRIEPASSALLRACRPTLPASQNINAIADLGASGARLMLVYENRVVHQRALPFAGSNALAQSLVDLVQGRADLAESALRSFGADGSSAYDLGSMVEARVDPVIEELIEQVGMSFAYVSHQYPAAELGPLVLTGAAAMLQGLSTKLSDGLGLPVYHCAPMNIADGGQVIAQDLADPGATLAAGLAMSQQDGKASPPINLIPSSMYAERARRRTIKGWSSAVILSLLTMLGMIVIGSARSEGPDTSAMQGRLNAAEKQSDQLIFQISRSRQRTESARNELASMEQVAEQPDLQLLFRIVGQQLGRQAMLTGIRLGSAEDATIRQTVGTATDHKRRWIVLAGIAEDHQRVPAIVLRLESLELFDQVVLHETYPESYRGSTRVGFRIACQLPEQPEEGSTDD
ncbi:MAG: pilus assembly protein PilM [Planctomycetota bacterium]